MYSTNSSFDILRSFLTQPPSAEVWQSICILLETWNDPNSQQLALEYAQQSLDALWPDELRLASVSWELAVQGEEIPATWGLARCLDLSKPTPHQSTPEPSQTKGEMLSWFARAFEREARLMHIRALKLSRCSLALSDIEALFLSPAASRLTALDVSYCQLRDADVQLLASSEYLGALESLDLQGNRITIAGLTFLSSAPNLQNLKRLNLAFNAFQHKPHSKESLEYAFDAQHLISLDLSNNSFGRFVDLFTLSSAFVGVHNLNLSNTQWNGSSLGPLLASPHLNQLQSLDLNANRLGEGGAIALAACEHLVELRALNLSNNTLTTRGAAALLNAPWMRSVESLDLSRNDLPTSQIFSDLSRTHDAFDRLETLNVAHNSIGVDVLRVLTQGFFPNLSSLDVAWNSVPDEAMLRLSSSPCVGHLRSLGVEGNPINAEGILAMARSPHLHPDLQRKWSQWAQGLARMGLLDASRLS